MNRPTMREEVEVARASTGVGKRLWLLVTDETDKEIERRECWVNRRLTDEQVATILEAERENFDTMAPEDFQ